MYILLEFSDITHITHKTNKTCKFDETVNLSSKINQRLRDAESSQTFA